MKFSHAHESDEIEKWGLIFNLWCAVARERESEKNQLYKLLMNKT